MAKVAEPDSLGRTPDEPSERLPFWDPRKLLEVPALYNFFQRTVGADKPRRQFIAEHVAPLGAARILEVGCGPGTNCAWLPEDIEYVGCDLSERYINHATQVYGDKYCFFRAPVGSLLALGLKPFTAVIALCLLHHLSDAQVLALCDEVVPLLEPGGTFMTADPCFTSNQGRLERFITARDRGRYVRYPEEYYGLLASKFSLVDVRISRSQGTLIPNSGVMLKARKS